MSGRTSIAFATINAEMNDSFKDYDFILDPFIGTGTTAVAAKRLDGITSELTLGLRRRSSEVEVNS